MKATKPIVIKLAETRIDGDGVQEMLRAMQVSEDGARRLLDLPDGAETVIELAGRMCYRSFELGLNPNVTKIRQDSKDYFANILRKGDGSIMEHGTVTFAFLNVSRVFTHELVRHRAGVAISQESLRYVRLKEIPFWIPDELSPPQKEAMARAVRDAEEAYHQLERTIPWDDLPMDTKKRLTSAIRRIVPDGIATNIIWTANHRTLRWVIEMRTDPAAEVEIRMVFDQVARVCKRDFPLLYQDFTREELSDGTGRWCPALRSKV
jgi:thymidylate synthase (FAD)